MFSPPFTPLKVTLMAIVAVAVWVLVIRQIRGQWARHRRKREVIAEGGLRSSRRWDQRTVATIIFIAVMLIAIGSSAYIEQHGTPLAKARLHEVDRWNHAFMNHFAIVLFALFALLFIILWLKHDPVIKAAAKLTRVGRHAEAEAMIRKRIEVRGPNEQRLTMLGLLLVEQNRLEESLQYLQEAQRLAKRSATAKNNCATILWKLGRREEVAQRFDEVCRQNPNNFFAVCNSCLLLAEMGCETPARERLQQAEQIFARYDLRYTKIWVPLLEQCRKAVPPAQGFPVIVPG